MSDDEDKEGDRCRLGKRSQIEPQVDHSEEVPQISGGKSQSMLLVGGLFEDISCFDRLQLVKVTKQKHAEAPKNGVDHGDLSQAEVEVIEHVCGDHADLIYDDASQISKQ